MEIRRGIIGAIWLLWLFSGASLAGNLCNQDCIFSISFPTGGSIEAHEDLTITFGDGGLIDTAGSMTAYLDGETLGLNANESLIFGNGGRFEIGMSGNIDFTDMSFTTEGTISLDATGGDAQIQILAGSRLSFPGAASINIGSSTLIHGSLVLGPAAGLNLSGPGMPAGCDLSSGAGATLTVNGANPITIDLDASCADTYATLDSNAVLTSGSLNVIDGAGNLTLGSLANVNLSSAILSANPLEYAEPVAAGFDWYLSLLLATLWTGKRFSRLRVDASAVRLDRIACHGSGEFRYKRSE